MKIRFWHVALIGAMLLLLLLTVAGSAISLAAPPSDSPPGPAARVLSPAITNLEMTQGRGEKEPGGDEIRVSGKKTEQAVDKGKPASDLPPLRTATSATYRLPDGRYATVVTAHSLNYRDEAGQWQPIDPRFTESDQGWMNLTNGVKLSLRRDSSQAKVWTTLSGVGWEPQKLEAISGAGAGRVLATALADVGQSALSEDGMQVRYANAWSLSDVSDAWHSGYGRSEYTMRLARLPEGVGHADLLDLLVLLHLAPGTRVQVGGKAIAAADLPLEIRQPLAFGEGEQALILQLPAIYEEVDATSRTGGNYLLTAGPDPSTFVLHVRLPWAWLSAAERQFPVVIDPIFQLRSSNQVQAAHYDTDGNFLDYVNIENEQLALGAFRNGFYRVLLHFEPPPMPAFTSVSSAYLMAVPTDINRSDLDFITRHWQAHALTTWPTGATAPSFSSTSLPTVESDLLMFSRGLDTYDRVGWDVTGQLQNHWFQMGAGDFPGILLRLAEAEETCHVQPDPQYWPFWEDPKWDLNCGGFYVPYPSQFSDEDLAHFETYFGAGTLPPFPERGGIALVVIYNGPQLVEGQVIPGDNPFDIRFGNPIPSGDIYYHAAHDYRLTVGNHWQAVVARGLGERFGPVGNPQPNDPIGRNLKGQVPLTLSTAGDVQLRPDDANDGIWAQSGHLGYALFNGRRSAGMSYHLGVAAQTGEGDLPDTYDIRLIGEKETISVGLGHSVVRDAQAPSGDLLTLWNLNLPQGSNARVDVQILGYNTPAGTSTELYTHARRFSGQLFRGDQGAPYGAYGPAIKLGSNASASGALDYGSVRLSSGGFQPETGNYALALAYDGPQINFYQPQEPPRGRNPETTVTGPTDLIYSVRVRVTACGPGTFPTSSGQCQIVRCPTTSFAAGNRREVGGLQLWSESGWNGQTSGNDVAPLIGPPGAVAPTVAVVGGVLSYSGDVVTVQDADSVMLVDCGSLSHPANPLSNTFDVYQGTMSSSAQKLRPQGQGLRTLNPWPPQDDAQFGFEGYWVAPLTGRAEDAGILLRQVGNVNITFTVAWGVNVNGWPSLSSTVSRIGDTEPPPVAGLSLALGDAFSMDTDPVTDKATTRLFRAVRASTATITQPANLGGASKPVQALILSAGTPIPAQEPITCAGSCLDLRNATMDTPSHPDRQWNMPDIHTTGEAGTVVLSKAGELVVYSKDHPLAAQSGQDVSQSFSFDTFGAGVTVEQAQCLGQGPEVQVISGKTEITLPNVGDSSDPNAQILAEFTLCESAPGAGDTSLHGVHLHFKSPVGIPVDGSGLFVTGLEGKVDIFPDYTTIQLGMDLQAAQGGDGGMFKGHGTVTIDTRGLFDLQGNGKLLGTVNVDGELFVAWNPMDIAMDMGVSYGGWLSGNSHIHVWQGQGWQHRYPWLPDNAEKHFAAQFSATLKIEQGAAFSWWFIDIPPDDMSFGVEVAFGQFCTNASCTSYEWGVKGAFSVAGYHVGMYYGFDKGFDFILGNDGHKLIDQYGGSLAALGEDAVNRVRVEAAAPAVAGVSQETLTVTSDTENLLVALGWQAGTPQLKLLDADGVDVTTWPHFYTVAISQTANSLLMGVQLKQPRPGQWRAVISNISGREHYKFIYFANKGAPGTAANRGRFLAPASGVTPGNGSYTIRWGVPADTPAASTISLLYTRYTWSAILGKWRVDSASTDTSIVQNLLFDQGHYVWDTSGLASGRYALRAVVHDGVNDLPDTPYNPDDPCRPRPELPPTRAFASNRFPGLSTFSSAGQIEINDTTPPAAPTGLDLYPVNGAILARWDLGTEKDLSAYIVRWGTRIYNPFGGGWRWLSYNEIRVSASTTPHARLGGLTNDTTYSVMVRAVDASGNEGANSDIITATPTVGKTLPSAPGNLTLTGVDSHSTSFSWTAPASALSPNWHPPTTGYRLHYRKIGEDSAREVLTTATSATLSNLETGATYLVWVGQLVDITVDSVTGTITDPGWEGAVSEPLRVVISNGVDANGDGLPDDWAAAYHLPSGSLPSDLDHDGLSNAAEYQQGTDPMAPDSDGDGFSDGEEVAMQTDPLSGQSYGAEHQYAGVELGVKHLVFHAKVGQKDSLIQEVPYQLLYTYQHLQAIGNQSWLSGGFLETPHGSHFTISAEPHGLEPGYYSGAVQILPDPATAPLLGDRCVRVELWVSPGEVYTPLVLTP